MKLVERFERIKKMNGLIRSGHTGTPAEFAVTMGLSQSHLFRCLHELESYGMDIQYSRTLKTYFYNNDNELTIKYSMKLITATNSKEIIGGNCLSKRNYTELHREAQSYTE
jgi:hypothetical protein